MSLDLLAGLVILATVAGLDLVSVLQGMVSRPLVVATAAGLIVGDVEAGLRVGAVLELFALDVIPVGAARYPDFGAATVSAVMVAAGSPWAVTLGAAVGLGLLFAIAGGTTIPPTRRLNARSIRARAAALGEGDARAVERVHWRCLGHDLVRSLGLGIAAVAGGWVAAGPVGRIDPETGRWLSAVALAGGVWAVTHGAVVVGRTGPRWRWGLVGVVAGLMLIVP